MSTHKHIDKICVAVFLCTILITLLFMNGKRLGIQAVVDEDAESYEGSVYFTANDQDGEWDTENATVITLNGTEAKVSGQGAYAYDGGVVISNAGTYVISGTLTDGSIVVDTYSSSKVWILLSGVDITCEDNACIQVEEADKVFLTLAAGTVNTLTGGEEYSAEAQEDGTDGVIYAHDDLTINGSGSLTINAQYKHGIEANDDLVITGGNISIEAVKDGISANDSFRLMNADITIQAGDEGIKVTTEETGYFYMESGTLNVTSDGDSIHAAGDVTIQDGTLTLSSQDDGVHADGKIYFYNGSLLITECYEGLEASAIEVYDGDITITSSDDGFNANGATSSFGMGGGMNFGGMNNGGMGRFGSTETEEGAESGERPEMPENGSFESGEMPEAPENFESGEMPERPEGFESGEMPEPPAGFESGEMPELPEGFESGEMPQAPMDMGESASAGENAGSMQDAAVTAENSETEAEDEECYILIAGGTITILNETGNDADGLDTNGDLIITGGDIRVSLQGQGSNNAIDYGSENGGTATISGGTLVAAGGASMAESFDTTSEQPSILYTLSETAEAGTKVSLLDENGTVLLSYEVPYSFTSLHISCPDLQVGKTYQLVTGDQTEEITLEDTAGTYGNAQNSTFGGGMGGMNRNGSGNRMGRGTAGTAGETTEGTAEGSTRDTTRENAEGTTGETTQGNTSGDSQSQNFGNRTGKMGGFGQAGSEESTEENAAGGSNQNFGGGRGSFGQGGNSQNGIANGTVETEETVETSTGSIVTSEQWLWIVGSLLVLAGGLFVTRFFGKYR